MKRLWIGIALLGVFLVLGVVTTLSMSRLHEPLAEELSRASQAVQTGNWSQASQHALRAKTAWETHRKLVACVADHDPMEQIDSLFCELQIYLDMRQDAAFAACCANLKSLTSAMGEAHALSWWNLL